MASLKVEIYLKKKKTHPEHKNSVTFVSKVGTTRLLVSARSPECFECFLRFCGAVIALKN